MARNRRKTKGNKSKIDLGYLAPYLSPREEPKGNKEKAPLPSQTQRTPSPAATNDPARTTPTTYGPIANRLDPAMPDPAPSRGAMLAWEQDHPRPRPRSLPSAVSEVAPPSTPTQARPVYPSPTAASLNAPDISAPLAISPPPPPIEALQQQRINAEHDAGSFRADANRLRANRELGNANVAAVNDARDPMTPAAKYADIKAAGMDANTYESISGQRPDFHGYLPASVQQEFSPGGRAYSNDTLAGRPILPPMMGTTPANPHSPALENRVKARGDILEYDPETQTTTIRGGEANQARAQREAADRSERGKAYARATRDAVMQARSDNRIGQERGISGEQVRGDRIHGQEENARLNRARVDGQRELLRGRIATLQSQQQQISEQYNGFIKELGSGGATNVTDIRDRMNKLDAERERISQEIAQTQSEIELAGVSHITRQNYLALRQDPAKAKEHLAARGISVPADATAEQINELLDKDFNNEVGSSKAADFVRGVQPAVPTTRPSLPPGVDRFQQWMNG